MYYHKRKFSSNNCHRVKLEYINWNKTNSWHNWPVNQHSGSNKNKNYAHKIYVNNEQQILFYFEKKREREKGRVGDIKQGVSIITARV